MSVSVKVQRIVFIVLLICLVVIAYAQAYAGHSGMVQVPQVVMMYVCWLALVSSYSLMVLWTIRNHYWIMITLWASWFVFIELNPSISIMREEGFLLATIMLIAVPAATALVRDIKEAMAKPNVPQECQEHQDEFNW